MSARYTVGMTRIASLLLLFALAGCGNKGPLVMAGPAPASATQPAEAVPEAVPEAVTEPAAETAEPPTPVEPVPATSGTPAH